MSSGRFEQPGVGSPGQGKEYQRARRLCRQIGETLDLALPGESDDPLLHGLHVLSVDPAPDASRLLVTLWSDLPEDEFDRPGILAALQEELAYLRTEVASAITRKRVPNLLFNVVPSWEHMHGEGASPE